MQNNVIEPLKGKNLAFNADNIVTLMHQHLLRDLSDSTLLYGFDNDGGNFAINSWGRDFAKKYAPMNDVKDKERLDSATYSKFLAINEHMSNYRDLQFPTDRRIFSHHTFREKVLLRARSLMHFILTPFDEEELYLSCRNSGGSSLGVPFIDTSQERKFTFPITMTKAVVPYYESHMRYDGSLSAAIKDFNGRHPLGEIFDVVEASRATTVPKSNKINRMIAIEPTGNMFFQQGLMKMIYKRMKYVGLDVAILPDTHKDLAWKASIDASLATIDFSSASDCVSIELLKYLLPETWFDVAEDFRASHMTIQGHDVELQMFSTMGNAVTFPLESLLFYTLAIATHHTKTTSSNTLFPDWELLSACSVFGDDCIIPTESAQPFMDVCTTVGLLVNFEKSFYKDEGFRESCGGDYYRGMDVRPYFIKRPTSQSKSALEPWLNIVLNSVLKKYKQYFGPLSYLYDKSLLRYIFWLYRENNLSLRAVPPDYPSDSGVFISHDIKRVRRHYKVRLHPVSVDEHGTRRFTYLKFRYRISVNVNDPIRYALKLRNFSHTDEAERLLFTQKRRLGGYVVAKGLSGHWSDT